MTDSANATDPISPAVLFLCTGNYYRSRYAEVWFNHLATQHGVGHRAHSRGLELWDGNKGPISPHTLGRIQLRGLSLDGTARNPVDVTRADLTTAGQVIAVKEAEHRPRMQSRFADLADTITYWTIHDLDAGAPDDTLDQIESQVTALFEAVTQA